MKIHTNAEIITAIMGAQNWLDPSEVIDKETITEMVDEALENNEDQDAAVTEVMTYIEDRAVECARDRGRTAGTAAHKILFGDNSQLSHPPVE